MHTPRILLVDDDISMLQALRHMIMLRLHGVNIDTATSAPEALEMLQEHEYDTIISDIKMPGMDGLELLTKIHEAHPDTPTLLITGHGDQTLITQALRGGAYDFIQKPIDRVYFVAALHRAIQTSQLRRQVQKQHQELEEYAQSLEQLVEQRMREFLAANEAIEVLVRDTLDISLLTSNDFILHRSRCNLVEVCQHVLDAYTAGAGIVLDFEVASEPVEVEIDRDRISQVLINLIFNARKLSYGNCPIKVLLQQTQNAVNITVQEIEMEEISEHPLEQFYRRPHKEAQTNIEFDGGSGLFLSQQIVAKHDGHIEIQNNSEMVNSFSLILPLARQLSEPDGV
ncbi:MAG TPA: hybrid sensor histidine kinase/response regulator [Ktedonobacteraceae bacterium]|nr:hybrid sensor histidine kinase/response regulator [Ktedonobacteraceae bacterium]